MPTRFDPTPPVLTGPRLMRQFWADISFVHWAVDPARVAPLLPRGTRPDELDGRTFVGLIPFRMVRAGFGRGPAVWWLGDFCETNVRLYSVDEEGRHGVVFASLESERLAVALGARLAFGTPYTWARMRHARDGRRHSYRSARRWPGPRGAGGRVVVRAGAPLPRPAPVDDFVTARFGLHTGLLGRTWWIPNTHAPWPLHSAEVERLDDTLLAAVGFGDLIGTEPVSVLHSAGVRTSFGWPRPIRRGAADRLRTHHGPAIEER